MAINLATASVNNISNTSEWDYWIDSPVSTRGVRFTFKNRFSTEAHNWLIDVDKLEKTIPRGVAQGFITRALNAGAHPKKIMQELMRRVDPVEQEVDNVFEDLKKEVQHGS